MALNITMSVVNMEGWYHSALTVNLTSVLQLMYELNAKNFHLHSNASLRRDSITMASVAGYSNAMSTKRHIFAMLFGLISSYAKSRFPTPINAELCC